MERDLILTAADSVGRTGEIIHTSHYRIELPCSYFSTRKELPRNGFDHFCVCCLCCCWCRGCWQQEVLSELGDILAAEAAGERAAGGSDVSMGVLTAAVHLLKWDQQVVSFKAGTPAYRGRGLHQERTALLLSEHAAC